jgi:plasmid stabilization system protein ParE
VAVHKSDAAEADLETIWLESAADYGEHHAQRVLNRLDALFALLDDFPNIGLGYPKIPKEVKYFPVRNYPFLIFYVVVADGISIVRILPDMVRVESYL